jgi:hypothetical protein
MMINVQECYLICLLPQYEENCLDKLNNTQHNAVVPPRVYAKHFSVFLAWFDILNTLPSVSEGKSMIMELML